MSTPDLLIHGGKLVVPENVDYARLSSEQRELIRSGSYIRLQDLPAAPVRKYRGMIVIADDAPVAGLSLEQRYIRERDIPEGAKIEETAD